MARVLWVQNLWLEYYGVMAISALLKEREHQSEVVCGATKEETLESIYQEKPDCIAFSCMTVQWKWAKEISIFIKESGIKIPTIMGGTHATMKPEEAVSIPMRTSGQPARPKSLYNFVDFFIFYAGLMVGKIYRYLFYLIAKLKKQF